MKHIFVFLVGILLSLNLLAAEKMPDGSRIPSKADTVVLASDKSADEFYRELKMRAVINDYSFESTDDDSNLFVTNYKDITKRASVQFKVYVKDVSGGSNAVYSGEFMDIKKLKTKPWFRSQPIRYRGKGKAADHAWEAFFRFAVGSKKWKYTFLKR